MPTNLYSQIETRSSERIALAPGSYGTSKEPGLKILSHIGVKADKTGAARHNFLVAATRPNREQLQQAAAKNGDGGSGAESSFLSDYEGTAFFALTIHEMWLAPESVALAFTEASRTKDGKIGTDLVPVYIADGAVTQESIDKAVAHFTEVARNKVINANTPEDQFEEAAVAQYRKELMSIAIKIGQFFALQDAKNKGDKEKRDLHLDPASLVGTEFSGKVEKSGVGEASEVVTVYSFKG